jgi:hypothetical protein
VLVVALALLAGFAPAPAYAAKLVALVVGVAAYKPPLNALAGPPTDVNAMTASLQAHGFKVFRQLNPDVATFQQALTDFYSEAKGADVALVYYSGHGFQTNGVNYFVPLDGRLDDLHDFQTDFIQVDSVLHKLDQAGAHYKLIFMDACRSNPFTERTNFSFQVALATAGMAEQGDPVDNALIGFASAPGQTSIDLGSKLGGVYTAALADVLSRSQRIEVHDLTSKTHDMVIEVFREAKRKPQIPWSTDSIPNATLYLTRTGGGAVVAVEPQLPADPPAGGFVIADSGHRALAVSDLARLSPAELRIARNEIFARHGRIFASPDLIAYFSKQSWYRPVSADVSLSAVEDHNVALLRQAETANTRSDVVAPAPSSDFIFPDSDKRLLTAAELAPLSAADLRIARNEIYARRGRFFASADLTARFQHFSWYKPYTMNPGLNAIERANVAAIQERERGG